MKTSSRQHKPQAVQAFLGQSTAPFFPQAFTQTQLNALVSDLLPRYRDRLFTPVETLSLFIQQALSPDGSCQAVLDSWLAQRALDGRPLASCNTAAYCMARQKLSLSFIQAVTKQVGALVDQEAAESKLWCDRPVRMIDGTSVTLADTAPNRELYPKQRQKGREVASPLCRVSALICYGSGALLNAASGPFNGKGSDEQTLLRSMLHTLNERDILLGDAFYPSYLLLNELHQRQVDGLFAQYGARRRSTDFTKGSRLASRDHLITYRKPPRCPDWMSDEDFARVPKTLCLRELEVKGQLLVTTLLDAKRYPKRSLYNLFKKRWNIELDLRDIKTTLGMEYLRCKTPSMVEKELWVYLLAFNMIRWLMVQAARKARLKPRSLSFKHTLQLYLAWQYRGVGRLGSLLRLITKIKVGQRPGRVEPRALKRRPKPYRLLLLPRAVERELIRIRGHIKRNVAREEIERTLNQWHRA